MKRLKYAVILLLGLSMATTMMTSCKKDNAQSIVGKWEVTNEVHSNYGAIPVGYLYSFTAEGMTTFPLGIGMVYNIKGDTLFVPEVTGTQLPFIIDEITNSTLKISGYRLDAPCVMKRVN